MGLKAYAAALAAAIAVTAFAAPPADAQTQSKAKRYYVGQQGRVVAVNRPRARVTVAPRSFLDAGTEVLPGDRKFTDYAFPPAYFPMGTVTNTGGVATGTLSVTLGGTNPSQFHIVTDNCTSTLAASASCTVIADFRPTAAGAAAASLIVSGTPGGTASASISGVSGCGSEANT